MAEPITPERLDDLVDTDPLQLRDEAVSLLAEVERLRLELECERVAGSPAIAQALGKAERERDEAQRAAATLRRERDLAIAHDRQPYPTADAYEKACAALWNHRDRADRLWLAWQSARRGRADARGEIPALEETVAAADEDRDRLAAQVNRLTAKFTALAQVKSWTNEDGRKFVFVDDLLDVLQPDLAREEAS